MYHLLEGAVGRTELIKNALVTAPDEEGIFAKTLAKPWKDSSSEPNFYNICTCLSYLDLQVSLKFCLVSFMSFSHFQVRMYYPFQGNCSVSLESRIFLFLHILGEDGAIEHSGSSKVLLE